MSMFGLNDLRRILTAVAGEDDKVDLSGDISDVRFEDLGYDSLALMEMATRISREYGIRISDEEAANFETPRDVLAAVEDGPRGIGTRAS
jgi:minimal PKS acyl carrier protein